MKKSNVLLLFIIAITILFSSCSSTKKSSKKGGGWYKNRNVNQLKIEDQKSLVYQSKEYFQKKQFQFE